MSDYPRYQKPEHRKPMVPAFLFEKTELWQPCLRHSYSISSVPLESGLRLRQLRIPSKSCHGKKILFFSDLHVRNESVVSLFPFFLIGRGISWLEDAFQELFENISSPDYILFGGDMVSEASLLDNTLNFLAKYMPATSQRYAVTGNWEMRRIWLRNTWKDIFQKANFSLLKECCPNDMTLNPCFEIRGIADAKEDYPKEPSLFMNRNSFHCVLTHSPDSAILALSQDFLTQTDLILAGHTHGGQIRFPGLRAAVTSSRFKDKFAYGLYEHKQTRTLMYVTAGIGVTWFHVRMFQPPEVLLIEFI